jgi:hypothetical protein
MTPLAFSLGALFTAHLNLPQPLQAHTGHPLNPYQARNLLDHEDNEMCGKALSALVPGSLSAGVFLASSQISHTSTAPSLPGQYPWISHD